MADWINTKTIFASRDFDGAVTEAAKLLQNGELVVFPTETVYGLGAVPMARVLRLRAV